MATTQLVINIIANATQTTRAINNVNSQVQNMSRGINRSTATASRSVNAMGDSFLKTALKATAVVAGVETIGAAIGRVVNYSTEFIKTIDDSRAAFKVMTDGSSEEADKLLSKVVNLARTSPLSTEGVVKATTTLMSFGVGVEDVENKLVQLGDIARGDNHRFDRLALAFGQVQAAGRLMGQETLQFINAGFNPLAEIAQALSKRLGGMASDYMPKLKKAMEDAEISVQTVSNAMKLATSEGGRFNGMMEAMSKTFSGQLNIFKDNAIILIGAGLKPITDYLTNVLLPTASAAMEMIIMAIRPFGITLETIAEREARLAKESAESAKGLKKMGKEAEDTDKAFQSNLQSFDQLHVLQKEIKKDVKKGGLGDLEKITQEAADAAKKSKIVEKVDKIKESLQSFFNMVKNNPLVVSSINLFRSAWDLLKAVIDAISPNLEWLYYSILIPLGQLSFAILIKAIDGTTEALKGISDWVSKNKGLVSNMANIVIAFGASWLVVTKAIGIATSLWKTIIVLKGAIVLMSKAFWAFLISPMGIVIITITALIGSIILMMMYWDQVKETVATVAGGFAMFANSIQNGVIWVLEMLAKGVSWLIWGLGKLWTLISEPWNFNLDTSSIDEASKKIEEFLGKGKTGLTNIEAGMAVYDEVRGWKSPLQVGQGSTTNGLTPTVPSLGKGFEFSPNELTGGNDAENIANAVIQAQKTNAIGNTSTNSSSQNISLSIDGKTFARLVAPYLNEENKRIGNIAIT